MTSNIVSHTPGPLFVRQPDKWPFHILTVNEQGQDIFSEHRHAYGTNQATVAEVLSGSCFGNPETRAAAVESNGRQLADAYLRAAAPELLAALQGLFNGGYLMPFTSDTDDDIRLKNQARIAIVKAIGTQP